MVEQKDLRDEMSGADGARLGWEKPRLHRMRAGSAEAALTPALEDSTDDFS